MSVEAPLIVSVSGIRGIVGEGLTPEAATAFAAALGDLGSGRPRRAQPRRPAQRRHAAPRRPGRAARGRLRGPRPRRRADADLRPGRPPLEGRGRRPDHRQPQPRAVERPEAVRPRRARCSTAAEGARCKGLFEAGPLPPGRAGTSWATVTRMPRRPRTGTATACWNWWTCRASAPAQLRVLPRRQRRRRRAARPAAARSAPVSAGLPWAATPTASSPTSRSRSPRTCATSARWCRSEGAGRRLRPRPRRRPAGPDRRDRAATSARS